MPGHASEITIRIRFGLSHFQNTEGLFNIEIENTVNLGKCSWKFSVAGAGVSKPDHFFVTLNGDDPGELQASFNRLLRHMMEVMNRWIVEKIVGVCSETV